MAPEKCISSQHSVPSTDGALVAIIEPGRLTIRSATTTGVLQTYKLPSDSVARCRHIRWSRTGSVSDTTSQTEEDWLGTQPTRRILLADDDNIRVYDPTDRTWRATITSASNSFGKIADVAFGSTPDEVLVFSNFGVKMTIWSLVTSRGIEIRDPKYSVSCYSYRPSTGHLALLTRGGAQDVMMILKTGSYEVLRSVELGTIDAQEVAWSGDGRWIVVRDAASAGHKVQIYTADGQLFKTWSGEARGEIGLGIKSMQWNQSTGALVVGDYNDGITFLRNETFSTLATLQHTSSIQDVRTKVWEEQINAAKERSYAVASHPANPPMSESLTKSVAIPRHGVSVMDFSTDGSMLATRSDSMPTTTWIWSLKTGALITALIHHSPVKHIEWNTTVPDLLLVHCAIPEPVIHVWNSSWEAPKIISLPLDRATGRLEASWLQSPSSNIAKVLLSSSHQYITAQVSTTDGEIIPNAPLAEPEAAALSMGEGPEDMFDEGHSLDFSPVKISNGAVDVGDGYDEEGFGMTGEIVDDTFHYRRNAKAGG